MSVVQAPPPDRGISPLMSNNPFRNRVANSTSPVESPRNRPISTNPFLDVTEVDKNTKNTVNGSSSMETSVDKTTAVFDKININVTSSSPPRAPRRLPNGLGPRRPSENVPPGMRQPPPSGHRPSASEEERRRVQGKPKGELDIFGDSSAVSKLREGETKPRRNSESSVRDKTKLLDPEDERRRQERKRRESKRAGSKSSKPSRKLDVIDKLDVTSIYGTGLFHHDGPFDACNPHRNRKKEKLAPMQAFPKDSVNMVVGGSGPVNKRMDYDKFHGIGQEAHIDYHNTAVPDERGTIRRPELADRTASFDPTARETIHGDESAGLGTTTFLEGAPASRAAIQRRESENEAAVLVRDGASAGLSRKKSLALKLRGVRPTREGRSPPVSPQATGNSESNVNPFFESFDKNSEQRADPIEQVQERTGRARAPSSPIRNALERRNTGQSDTNGEQQNGKTGGFLGRMKSIKGVKPRAVRRDTSG